MALCLGFSSSGVAEQEISSAPSNIADQNFRGTPGGYAEKLRQAQEEKRRRKENS